MEYARNFRAFKAAGLMDKINEEVLEDTSFQLGEQVALERPDNEDALTVLGIYVEKYNLNEENTKE